MAHAHSSFVAAVQKTYKALSEAGSLPPGAAEIDDSFDWEAYAESFYQNLPEKFRGEAAAAGAPVQIWAAGQLPGAAVTHLITSLPVKALWEFLDSEEYRHQLWAAAKGFQVSAKALRQPVVRKRLEHWLEEEPEQRFGILRLWGASFSEPPAGGLGQLCYLAWKGEREEFLRALAGKETEVHELDVVQTPKVSSRRVLSNGGAELKSALKRVVQLEGQVKLREGELAQLRGREAQEAVRWEGILGHQEAAAKAELEKALQEADRLGRKLRTATQERDEFEIENKRLKKQLRHTQELLEAERKKSVELVKAPEKVSPAKPSAPARPAEPKGPLDEIFEWTADGRPVRVTARAVRRLIDRNDEDAVFTIMQALDALKPEDAGVRAKFLAKLGGAAPYYVRVLTHSTTRVLVDASNLARSVTNRNGKGQLKLLLEAREELRRRDCFPIVFVADASLMHHINEPAKFREMVERGEILVVEAGVEADEVLTREARRTGAFVVTNDARFFQKVSPDFEPPRIGFRVLDGTVILEAF